MKKIAISLILVAILSIVICFGRLYIQNKRTTELILNYIDSTSTQISEEKNIISSENTIQEDNEEFNDKKMIYTSILEIPHINLKEGLVDSTNNFESIKYAISIDKSSQYPNKNGNFICSFVK